MPERRVPIRTFKVRFDCPMCGGEMMPTGMVLLTHPPEYPHRCKDCGHEERMRKTYPCIEYEPED